MFIEGFEKLIVPQDSYIFPLLDTRFEGVKAKIPFGHKAILETEYNKQALSNKEFHW
jgi:phosphorylcholine metabolism protein LicD